MLCKAQEKAKTALPVDYLATATGSQRTSTQLVGGPYHFTPRCDKLPVVWAWTEMRIVELLTERELEILQLIAEGLSNQAIAERLIIALSTVKRHINNLFGKLAVQSRTQALVRARELTLL
jgi:ATP/maltotriose-dependent transcriptional regulator MalT